MHFFFNFVLLFNVIVSSLTNEKLDSFKEEDLTQLLRDEKYVIVLLSENEKCTGQCEALEDILLSVREDLVEDTGGWVIKSYAPLFAKKLGIQSSTIVFLRDGRPLIYKRNGESAESMEERLVTYLLMNKNSNVRNLTDDSFEHETQAGTGATTGDWLVMFTRGDCEECDRVDPVLEEVAVALKGRKNAAFVHRDYGAVTARRFGVKTFPSFILFRLGKIYRYNFDPKDADVLKSFAEDTFRNAKAEVVSPPKSPFDDVTEAAADWLKENPGTFLMSAAGILLAIAFVVLLNRPPPESWTTKKPKKKKTS